MTIKQLMQQQTGVSDPQELQAIELVLREDIPSLLASQRADPPAADSPQRRRSAQMAGVREQCLLTVNLGELSVEARRYLMQDAAAGRPDSPVRGAGMSLLTLRHPHGLMVHVPPVQVSADQHVPAGLRELLDLARSRGSSWLSLVVSATEPPIDEGFRPPRGSLR